MAEKRGITAEDLLRLRILTEARISPDGERIAFVVQEAIPEEDCYRRNIYLVPTAGGEPVAFTQGDHGNGAVCWSPDSRHIAFVSDRAKRPQIYLMPVGGGEARAVTEMPDGAISTPVFSPDGSRIAFVFRTKDFDEHAADGEAAKKALEREKQKARVITRLRFKEEGWGFLPRVRDQIWTVDVATGVARPVTSGPYDVETSPRWSPDGKRILFTSNREEEPDFDLNGIDLWTVDADGGGEPRRLPTQPGPCWNAAWTRDGKAVVYLGHEHPDDTWGFRNSRLWWTTEGGEPRCLTASVDRPFGDYTISDTRGAFSMGAPPYVSTDGEWVYAQLSDDGSTHLAAVPIQGGDATRVVGGDRQVVEFTLDAGGRRAALVIADATNPGEVYTCSLDGATCRDLRRLTDLNASLFSEVAVLEPERVAFENDDGVEVHGWVLKPPGFDGSRKHPLIFQIHGGPYAQYGHTFFHEFQVLASLGYVVLYTNPRGSQGRGEAYAKAIHENWGDRDYADCMQAVDILLARGYVDEARMGVAGGSYGGYMTNWIVGHTDRFRAAVTMRSVTNIETMFGSSDFGFETAREFGGMPWESLEEYRRMSPISYVDRITTPLLIIHSENDLRCPIGEAEQLYMALRARRQDVLFVRYPGEGHGLSRGGKPEHRIDRLGHIVKWFEDRLRAEGSPA